MAGPEAADSQAGHLVIKQQQDTFDNPNFSALNFVNAIYPDESTLTDIDKFVAVLQRQIRAVDKEIFQGVRAQGGAHTRAKQELEAAEQQVVELLERVKGIQAKAEESEALVQDICRDIRKLDYAKKHLTSGITALRRLAMLTAAVADLEACAGRRDLYKKSANLLEAVHQLLEYFQQYSDIPKVQSLSKRLAVVEQQLTDSVLDDFRVLMGAADVKVSADNLDRLAAGCLVVVALGPRVRDQLLDWMCDREMNIYQMFSSSGGVDVSKLDRFERRFQWFRSRMEERKAEWALFPEQWRVPQVLCITFCKITKAHLKRVLSDDETAQGGLRTDIGPLIKAVVATNRFEKDMAAAFGGGVDPEDEEGLGDTGRDEVNASEARKRLERLRQKQKQEETRRQLDQVGERARAERNAIRTTFEGAISEAFEPALHLYVAEEEKELRAYLETLVREEQERQWKPADEEGNTQILPSANKLFLKIRGSLTRCVRMISRGTTLLSLTRVFQTVLSLYCQALLQRLPKTASGQHSALPPFTGNEWYIRLGEEDERVVGRLLHTAEFCRETLESLAAAVQKDIKQALASQVDVSEEEGQFQGLTSACMNVLVLGINTKLDQALLEMARVRWDMIESHGDDSAYVLTIRKVLLESFPRLGALMDRTTISFLAEKVARFFVPRFHDTVTKCRRITDKGLFQLSIDCDTVRRTLRELPQVSKPPPDQEHTRHADLLALSGGQGEEQVDTTFASYLAYVERELGVVINIVKVLQCKPDMLVDTFLFLMPPSAQNMMEFARLCEMKGMSRQLQQQLYNQYQQKTAGAAGEASTAGTVPTGLAAAANNLGTFKLNMNNITALASNINFPSMGSRLAAPGSPAAASAAARGHQRGVSIAAAADAMARTKDTFAKVGTALGSGFAKIGTALGQPQQE